MPRQSLFLDQTGSIRFRGELKSQRITEDYAVVNLGWISVNRLPHQICVRLRMRSCSDIALARLLYWIADSAPRPLLLQSYVEEGKVYEKHVFPHNICVALSDWISAARIAHAEAIRSARLNPAALNPTSRFGAMLKFWKQQTEVDLKQLGECLSNVLGGRYVLFSLRSSDRHFALSEVGNSMPTFARETLRQLIGLPYIEHPDRSYGEACVTAYTRAIRDWEPVVEHVDAVVNWPGYGMMRRRYARLILPIRLPDGDLTVVCSTMALSEVGAVRELL